MCREDAPGTDTDKEKMGAEYSVLHRMTISTSNNSQIRKRNKQKDEESNEEEEVKEEEEEEDVLEMEDKSSATKLDVDEISVNFDEVTNYLCFFVVYFVYSSNRMKMNK